MKKEHLHQYIIGSVVAFSFFSFVFLNFYTGKSALSVAAATNMTNALETRNVEKDEPEDVKAAPKLVVVAHIFELAKKIVPSGK